MAKQVTLCKYCEKPATVTSESRLEGMSVVIKTYECGHTVTEDLVAREPVAVGNKLVCKTCLVEAVNGNVKDHEQAPCELVEIPQHRNLMFSRLLEFQKRGVEFLEATNGNAALLDEMGLGKTVQVLNFISQHEAKFTPVLYVVKASLRLNWAKEMINAGWLCDKKDPKTYPFILLDGGSLLIPGFRHYIVPMSLLDKYEEQLSAFGFKLLVVDESQAFSNTTTKRTCALLRIARTIPHKICTSGTPILNRASEYFPTLNLIKPDHWNNYASFLRNWIETGVTAGGGIKYKGLHPYRKDEFFRRTSPYILRRRKRDVLKDLPPFSRHFTVVDISDTEYKSPYNNEAKKLDNYIHSQAYRHEGGFARASTILGYLMRMRHLCGMAKGVICVEQAADFLESTEVDQKLIIGCLHDDVMASLRVGLGAYNPVMLGGGMPDIEKQKAIDVFQRPERRLAIAKILASGEGLNLQFCQNMIVLERMWNPGKEEQFEARIDRYGQEAPTVADYLVAKNTVDEDFSELVEEKRKDCGGSVDKDFDFELNEGLLTLLGERAARRRL